MSLIMDLIAGRLWQLVAAGVGVSVIITSCVVRDHRIEKKGEAKAVTKIEKANDNAAKQGKRAAERSTDSRVRGQRDPSTRDD